ncbi:MAG: phage portal protein [Patescibacteria group bacterium]|nr:phage portal protein [Patescibacteria group bacterium]
MSTYKDEDKFVQRYKERFSLTLDDDWSYRQSRLYILQKFYNGSIYDNLSPFYREYNGGEDTGQYIPLVKRRPSVIYKLAKIIVDTSVSMLFGEGHFPIPRCNEHDKTTQFLQYLTRKCDLRSVMLDAATKGSVGSVVILIKILDKRFYFEAIHSISLTPVFKRNRPDELESLIDIKKVDGATLKTQGYDIAKDDIKEQYFIQREWTESEEIYYKPYKVSDAKKEDFMPSKDEDRSVVHDLGFVPAIWIKNLPKSTGIDGHSTYEDILDINIEIDYQLSQHSRLLRYSSDPTLVVKNASALEGHELIKGSGALHVDKDGDAYYAEITNGPTKSVLEFVKGLRELALEMVRGNRSSPDKIHSAQSGEALKMLYFELISLVEEMRLTYGEYGLISLYAMCIKIVESNKYELDLGEYFPDTDQNCADHIVLDWPTWYTPSAMDKLNEAKTLETLLKNNIISPETATTTVADEYNILDVEEELNDIEKTKSEMYDKEASIKGMSVEPTTAKVEPEQK